MQEKFETLIRCPLFDGIGAEEIHALWSCLKPKQKKYEKDAFVFMEGDKFDYIGVVLSGRAHIIRDDYWGNRSIVAILESGALFGEAFAAGGIEESPVSVAAVEDSEIALINIEKILNICSSACAFHTKLIHNMVRTLARKNINLMDKIEIVTQRSTREKLMTYFSSIAKKNRSAKIEIPFNRQELADFLSVERSGLSAELCRMRDEGILTFKKNKFEILQTGNRD